MTALLTGFPGFLGSALVGRLLARGESVACLVQARYREAAENRAGALRADAPTGTDLTLLTGDITDPELGLDDPGSVRRGVDTCYHLAAVYDLGVAPGRAEAVNVAGTERVLDFARTAGVDHLHHVSTCYVSGRHAGTFGPEDLAVGQRFNNHYERTKYEAEVAVQAAMDAGLRATVYRPAVAVGDSTTGETDKFDGLYYLLALLDRQPRLAVAPVQPPAGRYEFNVVPRDFVVDAIAALSAREVTGVYQLADPNPPTVRQLLRLCGRALDRRVVPVPTHARGLGWLLARLPRVAAALELEPAALPYLSHPTRYLTPHATAALRDTGVACPPLSAYLDRLVAFMRASSAGAVETA